MADVLDDIVSADELSEVGDESQMVLEEEPKSPVAKKISFSYELDLTLLMEVTAVNPFKDSLKWKEVANNVTNSYRAISKNGDFVLSSRASRDRVNLMLTNLAKKDPPAVKALQRGCDKKQYETKVVLLEGIAVLKSTVGVKVTAKAKGITKGIFVDKAKGEAVRKAAMNTQVKRKADESELSEGKKVKVTNNGKDSILMNYLESKRDDEKSIREKQLILDERRLELEAAKLEADKSERVKFWKNAEDEMKLKQAAMQQEMDTKKMLFDLINNLKK